MDNVVSIDYEPVRQRFPWVGLIDTGEQDLSGRYREIMAEAQHCTTSATVRRAVD